MTAIDALLKKLESGFFDEDLHLLYPGSSIPPAVQKERIRQLLATFCSVFDRNPEDLVSLISSPLSLEIEGYFRDSYQGKIWNAVTDADCLGCAAENNRDEIRIYCRQYGKTSIPLKEKKRTGNLIEGILSGIIEGFENLGFIIRGFDVVIDIDRLPEASLSAAAALEMLIGFLINELFCLGSVSVESIVQMDRLVHLEGLPAFDYLSRQINGALGGILVTEFNCLETYTSLSLQDLPESYTLFQIDCRMDSRHVEVFKRRTADEIRTVSRFFDRDYPGDIPLSVFLEKLPALFLAFPAPFAGRARMLYLGIRQLEEAQKELEQGNTERFLHLFSLSGHSISRFLLDLEQDIFRDASRAARILHLCEEILGPRGIFRILPCQDDLRIEALVPDRIAGTFERTMIMHLGKEDVHRYKIRSVGAFIFS